MADVNGVGEKGAYHVDEEPDVAVAEGTDDVLGFEGVEAGGSVRPAWVG